VDHQTIKSGLSLKFKPWLLPRLQGYNYDYLHKECTKIYQLGQGGKGIIYNYNIDTQL